MRFLDAAGVPADRLVLLPQPAPVIDLHDAGTAALLSVVESRLNDERSLPQTEREALTQIVLRVLKRLGELPGRTTPTEKGKPTQ